VNRTKRSKGVSLTSGIASEFLFETNRNNTNVGGIHLAMDSVNKRELFTM
jgi:hypothetical protein